jgi:hypothetical protein
VGDDILSRGDYFLIEGGELLAVGGRPVLPRKIYDLTDEVDIVHGVLMVGGEFTDIYDFDPVITNIISQENSVENEGLYPLQQFYPSSIASVNRFVSVDGEMKQKLVIVPAQFRAPPTETPIVSTTVLYTPTIGTLRRYTSTDLIIFTAKVTETDFFAPSIAAMKAFTDDGSLNFEVQIQDDSGIYTTVVLYRDLSEFKWNPAYLTYDQVSGLFKGSVTPAPSGSIEYFVQSVDMAGNVAMLLNHGLPFELLSSSADSDGDGVKDNVDNCLYRPNPLQLDLDGDGVGNICDLNADGDGAYDIFDSFPLSPTEWFDSDGDGQGNNADLDDDNDGEPDVSDNCWLVPNSAQTDTDEDGWGDACDVDDEPPDVSDAFFLTYEGAADPLQINLTDYITNSVADARAVTNPDHGTLWNLGGNLFLYAPEEYYSGDDSFEYDVCRNGTDPDADTLVCIKATVYIDVEAVADPPTLEVEDTKGIEGQAMPLTITAALVDDDGSETLTVTVDVSTLPTGTVLSQGRLDASTGQWVLSENQLQDLTITIPDDGEHDVYVTATATEKSNGDQASVTYDRTAEVGFADLFVGSIQFQHKVLAVNEPFIVSAYFSDTGTLDSHVATWDWGDGNTCNTDVISDTDCSLTYVPGGLGTIAGTHAYTETGIYTITLTLKDKDDGGAGISELPDIIVSDATGGHVTGGGSIAVEPTACVPPDGASDKYCTGKANHGFIIKYNEDTGQFEGQTTFSFKKGGFDFYTEGIAPYEYLVILGDFAQFKGDGFVSYQGSVESATFVISIKDADLNPNDGLVDDLFGIKITLGSGQEIVNTGLDPKSVYGFGMLVSTGGSIVIH